MPWPPTHKIYDYTGPYPLNQLENARRELIGSLSDPSLGYEFERLKPMLGLDSRFGRASRPSPVVVNELRGHDIDKRSLPETAFTCSYDSPYFLTGRLPKSSPKLKRFLHMFPKSHAGETDTDDEPDDGTVASTSGVNNLPTNSRARPSATISSPQQLQDSIDQGKVEMRESDSPSTTHKRKLEESRERSSEIKRTTDKSAVVSKRKVEESSGLVPEKKKSKWGKEKGSSSQMNKSNNNNSEVSSKSVASAKNVQTAEDIVVCQSNRPVEYMKETFLVYKCDYCAYTNASSDELAEHLYDQSHRYGSLYRARKRNNTTELIYTEKLFAVKNSSVIKSPHYVFCTECDFASECVHTVALHQKYFHKAQIGSCSIVPIVENKIVRWDSVYDFYYECLREKKANVEVLVCPQCQYSATGAISDMTAHLKEQHNTHRSNVPFLTVKICSREGQKHLVPRLADPDEMSEREFKPELEILEKLQLWHPNNQEVKDRSQFLSSS